MTDTSTRPPRAGERVLFLATGLTFSLGGDGWSRSDGFVSRRGQVITLTEATIDANRDRLGVSAFDVLHDPDAQRSRWGEVRFRPLADGEEVPDYLREPEPGGVEAGLKFDAERLRILSEVADPDEQEAALRALRQRYRPRSSQHSTLVRGSSGSARLDAPRTGREAPHA